MSYVMIKIVVCDGLNTGNYRGDFRGFRMSRYVLPLTFNSNSQACQDNMAYTFVWSTLLYYVLYVSTPYYEIVTFILTSDYIIVCPDNDFNDN